ncbi:IMV membrane protein A9 [Monkeypox virus]|uniref:Virion membrane protein OPG135 n=2 Tax=Monkeypox virus TaxID=10244 RepID=PG135_MONPV|nr:IMV membrane protein A9 [Monkeypox virus]A0A7H0DNA7.1 RecName: Full=Virion membrane protein OPG135; Flags: Precursor [Monkeypox virus]AIE40733.1 IMV membrane protein [Monkeypox virus]AIE41086.1 IMV membrane protein [Monkeypox virus]AUW64201.1 IMV membrane protein [Monkeypox virus]AUW64450.1 IMV membrane protein [Monkeypox virus]QGQ59843.1 virion membrane protein A9 [Monkeypox virus]
MSCYTAILKSVGGLALFQVANGAIDLCRHFFMYFCEQKLRPNSFWFVVVRAIASMIMYLVLGIALLYISEQDDKKNTNNDSNSNNDKRNVSSINSNSSHK